MKSNPNLNYLNIAHTTVSDAVLLDIVSKCRSLIELDISRCQYLTEQGIVEAIQQAPKLKLIKIAHCNISTDTMKALQIEQPNILISSELQDELTE